MGDQQDVWLSPTHFLPTCIPLGLSGLQGVGAVIYGLGNLPGGREGASDPGGKSWASQGPVSSPGKKPWAFVISMLPLRG